MFGCFDVHSALRPQGVFLFSLLLQDRMVRGDKLLFISVPSWRNLFHSFLETKISPDVILAVNLIHKMVNTSFGLKPSLAAGGGWRAEGMVFQRTVTSCSVAVPVLTC